MVRYDLTFFLCCCKSFLGDADTDGEDFYALLKVERDATQDEIKRAYKRQSLQMHPDKLAQRGKVVTEEDQSRFTRMKEAYEVLSDPHKRETYDAIGERGMKWLEEPFSLDPQELAHNFARSSVLDRSKIFGIFVGIAIAVFLLPFMVCMQVDRAFGHDTKWLAVLTPLWIWDAVILFYHSRVIMMGPIPRPDHIPSEEWVDPLPMKKRIFSLVRFCLLVLFQFLVALKLDKFIPWPWFVVCFPLYVWEGTTLYKKWPLARMRIVTVEDLETALGKPFAEFTPAEKELIGQRYTVVPSTTSPDFEAAQKLKVRARHDMIKSGFRIAFILLLLVQLDLDMGWSWWFIFTPIWIMTALFCYANYQAFAEVQQMAMEKDPTLFGLANGPSQGAGGTNASGANGASQPGYGAMGKDGNAAPPSPLTEEEREELKTQVVASATRLCVKCCSQGFLLLIVLLFVGKIQGAGYSALLIISPVLIIAGLILCCIGCAIFGVTEVPTDGIEFDTGDDTDIESPSGAASPSPDNQTYVPPAAAAQPATKPTPMPAPPPPVVTPNAPVTASAPAATTATTVTAKCAPPPAVKQTAPIPAPAPVPIPAPVPAPAPDPVANPRLSPVLLSGPSAEEAGAHASGRPHDPASSTAVPAHAASGPVVDLLDDPPVSDFAPSVSTTVVSSVIVSMPLPPVTTVGDGAGAAGGDGQATSRMPAVSPTPQPPQKSAALSQAAAAAAPIQNPQQGAPLPPTHPDSQPTLQPSQHEVLQSHSGVRAASSDSYDLD